MSTEALQNSSNAFPSTFPDQYTQITDAGRNSRPTAALKPLLQRVQESDSKNWLYYQLFLRQDFDACDVAFAPSEDAGQPVQSTYTIYMKGLIAKRQGKLVEALDFMKHCFARDQRNLEVLKELTSLSYLTRAYHDALAYVALAKELEPAQDWFTAHHQGLCYERLGDLSLAEEHFRSAINIQPQEKAYITMAEFYLRHDGYDKAVDVLDRAKRVFPESLLLAARLGRLQIRGQQDPNKGFGNLAQAVSGTKANDESVLLAVGCVMQKKLDIDGAVRKYEVIIQDPKAASAAVLNNIGLCCMAKPKKGLRKDGVKAPAEDDYSQRVLQAIGCLKKAQQLTPMDWKITYNLGYLMRELRLYATASYYLMASIRLAQKNPPVEAYLLLAGVADNLDISNQANQLYKYCVKNNSQNDPVIYLNYATFLLREGEKDRGSDMISRCRDAANDWEQTGRVVDAAIPDYLRILKAKMPLTGSNSHVQAVKEASAPPGTMKTDLSGTHELVVSAQVEKNS